MIVKIIVSAIAYLILAPVIGGLLTGMGRIAAARLQGRKGPSVSQPFNDVRKLMEKSSSDVSGIHDTFVRLFLLFSVAAGLIFFAGCSLLLVIFAMMTASMFLIVAAYTSGSGRAQRGAQAELTAIASYMPMMLFAAIGFHLFCGSFSVRDIVLSSTMPVLPLIGIFFGIVFAMLAKFGASPFDKGMTNRLNRGALCDISTGFSRRSLALTEIAIWYQTVMMLALVFLFFCNGTAWGYAIGVIAAVVVYLIQIFVDNRFAKLPMNYMLGISWLVTVVLGIINVFVVYVIF